MALCFVEHELANNMIMPTNNNEKIDFLIVLSFCLFNLILSANLRKIIHLCTLFFLKMMKSGIFSSKWWEISLKSSKFTHSN